MSVSASVSAKVVTPVGSFSVGGGASTNIAKQKEGTVVVFRSGATDTDYLVRTGRSLRFELNGHVVEQITQNLVVITVAAGGGYRILVTDAGPPPPTPTPDSGCAGKTHRVRLPTLTLGPIHGDSVDTVRAKLRRICITDTRIDILHGGGDADYTVEKHGKWQPWPAGTVNRVRIPCHRGGVFFWHIYDYIDVSFLNTIMKFGTVWINCAKSTGPPDAPNETDQPGTLATVRSDKPAIIQILDGT